MRMTLWIAGACLAGLSASGVIRAEMAGIADSPYHLIIDRNPFGLKPPAEVVVVAPPPVTNPPPVKLDLKLSGISSGPKGLFAWFVVPPTPGKNTNTLYWKLQEWTPERPESQGDLRVLKIDPDKGSVKVENGGQVVTLDLETDAPAPMGPVVAAVVPGATPGVPGRPGVASARPVSGVRSALPSPATARSLVAPGGGSGGTAAFRAGSVGGASNPGLMRGGGVASSTVGGRNVPTRPIRTVAEPETPVDPAVQWLMMRAQEEEARAAGVVFPPTPPIPGFDGPPGPGDPGTLPGLEQ